VSPRGQLGYPNRGKPIGTCLRNPIGTQPSGGQGRRLRVRDAGVNRPGVHRRLDSLSRTVPVEPPAPVGGLELRRRDVADRLEQASVVEPVHPLQRRVLDVVDPLPRTGSADHFGRVEADDPYGREPPEAGCTSGPTIWISGRCRSGRGDPTTRTSRGSPRGPQRERRFSRDGFEERERAPGHEEDHPNPHLAGRGRGVP